MSRQHEQRVAARDAVLAQGLLDRLNLSIERGRLAVIINDAPGGVVLAT